MSKLDEIKNKIKAKGGFNKEVESFANAIEKKALEKAEKSSSNSLIENVDKLILDVRNLLESNEHSGDKLINFLEKKDIQTKEDDTLDNKNFKEVIDTLHLLAKQIAKPQKGLTEEEVKNAFEKSLQAIEKILVNQNEVPSSTVMTKKDGHVTRIYEEYSTYSLTYSYSWDSSGGFKEKVIKKLL
jgi:hypothetical protein